MADSIIFRGTHIRYFDGRQEEGGAFVRVHLTSEFTEPVMQAMDWDEPGSSVTDAKLDGELHAINFILTPGDKQLQQHEIQFPIRSVEDFKVVTIEKDEVKRRELRFIVKSPAEGVAALVDNYIRRIGEHQGALKVSYTSQDQLDLQAAKDAVSKPKLKETTGCRACDAKIPLAENDDAMHVDGQDCMAWDRAKTAAGPVSEPSLAGATAAERKKARQAEEARKKELREQSTAEAVQ